jgi:transcriptional regulator with GAF, ATPase, and Fis domain
VLEDRGSKNGTFLNGRAISGPTGLEDGDVCRCGQTIFVFRSGWPTDPSSPAVLEGATGTALATLVPWLALRFDELARVAASDVPVLLLGETGTGKEVTAGAVHALSQRRGELVTVNCGAIPRQLVESTLFGHKRGAFSGAVADQPGLFRSADGGTLFLDEVGDLPAEAQAALLRALQDGEIRPLGASRTVKTEARIVAATNLDIEALVRAGTFREDLVARLAGFSLRLPPLRERREDLGLLVSALVRRLAPSRSLSLTSAAGEALFAYAWPRNVRELEKCLARACALATSGEVDVAQLELPVATAGPPLKQPVGDEARRAQLIQAMTTHKGNLVWVARALKTSRSQVHRWLKRFGLSPEDFRS